MRPRPFPPVFAHGMMLYNRLLQAGEGTGAERASVVVRAAESSSSDELETVTTFRHRVTPRLTRLGNKWW